MSDGGRGKQRLYGEVGFLKLYPTAQNDSALSDADSLKI